MDLTVWTAQFILWSQGIAETWGYIGIFLISLVGSASIVFPIPAFAVIFVFGGILNPFLVGLIAGIGCAIGELTGYLLGLGGHKVIKKRNKEWMVKVFVFNRF